MINIDGFSGIGHTHIFSYSLIENMYKGGRSGHGIQVNNPDKEQKYLDLCLKLTDLMNEFNELAEENTDE